MADVGDVHDMLDAVSKQFECSSQDVCVQEGAEVPDVRIVVDGGAAGVESDQTSLWKAIERLSTTGECVMETENGHSPMIRAR